MAEGLKVRQTTGMTYRFCSSNTGVETSSFMGSVKQIMARPQSRIGTPNSEKLPSEPTGRNNRRGCRYGQAAVGQTSFGLGHAFPAHADPLCTVQKQRIKY